MEKKHPHLWLPRFLRNNFLHNISYSDKPLFVCGNGIEMRKHLPSQSRICKLHVEHNIPLDTSNS